ncbi:MAG: DNA cytosine methyltransferase [Opitutaceae bacterium]
MNELALFAGAGGGILGGTLLGWRTVCACELDEYARAVLIARQNDGTLPPFPIWDDVRTFDGKPWRGLVDIITGGFPCQDISAAGSGAGIDGARSGLWSEMARIIREVGPRYVLVENSPILTSRGLGRVVGDLAAMGYDARWGVLGAIDAGAPHQRDRIWIVAHAELPERRPHSRTREALADAARVSEREPTNQTDAFATRGNARDESVRCGECAAMADADGTGHEEQRSTVANGTKHEAAECGGWWAAEPNVGRMAHGVAARVDRLRCLGNGQVPAVAALAWETLTRDL